MGLILNKFSTLRSKIWLSILAALLVLKFALMPAFGWLGDQKEQIELLQNQIRKKLVLQEKKDSIAKLLIQLQNDGQAYQAFFFPSNMGPEKIQLALQKDLEQFASKTEVTIKNLDWLPAAKEDAFIWVPIKMRCQGTPQQMVSFFREIEGAKKHYGIESIHIRPEKWDSFLKVDLDVVAYGIAGE